MWVMRLFPRLSAFFLGCSLLFVLIPNAQTLCPVLVPPLYNAQNPINYGADNTGSNDSSAAFGKALGSGDLDVPAGTFLINVTVSVPNGRRIKCESGAVLKTTSISGYTM